MTLRFFLFLLPLSFFFTQAFAAESKTLTVVNGVFDASHVELTSHQRIEVNGHWCFNWQAFISPTTVCPADSTRLSVPSKWNKLGDTSYPRNGYASYSVHIELPHSEQQLGLYVPTLYRAATVWINGELVKQVGVPGTTRAEETPKDSRSIIPIAPNVQAIDVVIHVSSFSHIDGGMNQSVELALLADLQHYERIRSVSSVFLVGSSISFALYFFVIGLRGNKQLDWVYVAGSATIMSLTLRVIGVEQLWLLLYPNADANWILRFEYYGLYFALPTSLFFLYQLFPQNTRLSICKFALALGVISAVFTTLMPTQIYAWLRDPWVIIYPIGFLYIFYIVVCAIRQQRQYSKIIGALMVVIVLTTFNDYLIWFQIINGRSLVNLTYLAMIAGNIIVLIIRLVHASRMEETLMDEINELNVNLQQRVDERTAQLSQQQSVLETQNEKLLEMDKLKSQFLANISHEFRTPLTLIKGPLSRLLSGEFGEHNSQTTQALQTSNRNVGRLARLMEELLTLSHLESSQL